MAGGFVGILSVDLHLPEAGSLKAKRRELQRVKQGLARRFSCAVSEVDHHDLWQRSTIGVVSIAAEREPIDKMFQKVLRAAEHQREAQLISVEVEFL